MRGKTDRAQVTGSQSLMATKVRFAGKVYRRADFWPSMGSSSLTVLNRLCRGLKIVAIWRPRRTDAGSMLDSGFLDQSTMPAKIPGPNGIPPKARDCSPRGRSA
jgi:hypothetical protein